MFGLQDLKYLISEIVFLGLSFRVQVLRLVENFGFWVSDLGLRVKRSKGEG